MKTEDYISLKKERSEIAARFKAGTQGESDASRYKEIQDTIRKDPPTIDQKYAAMFEG